MRGLESFDCAALLAACGEDFTLEAKPSREESQAALDSLFQQGRHAFALYDGKSWTVLALKDTAVMEKLLPEKSQAYRTLDVSILHSLVLEKLLGIDKENMANQKNLTYTRSAEEAQAAVDRGESQCCFLLNPTRVEEIGQVAANGEKIPQKSTSFYPMLITGLAMNDLETPAGL